jgi:hypothetical protein
VNPNFLLRSARNDHLCGFRQGKPHEVRQRHQPRQEIRETGISCYAALEGTTCAAFVKESRMKFANATDLDRKFGAGAAEGPVTIH